MKKKVFTIMLVLGTMITLAGCDKKESAEFEKGQEKVSSETNVEEFSSATIDLSETAKSYAKDKNVKAAQEEYMQTLHSVKGESVVTRIECDGVDYTEKIKTEEEENIDVYYYSF